ncbi:MAG: dihydropteroate synthase [Melioribacteraceae bacterium]|nr:dihydropteroate synthase [Melioribacteraceae bacterium]
MTIQIINFSSEDTFKHYSKKYNIYRELFSSDHYGLELRQISKDTSKILQQLCSDNGDISYTDTNEKLSDFLIFGTISSIKETAKSIISNWREDAGHKISHVIDSYYEYSKQQLIIGEKKLSLDKCYIMGILNVTPDSFSDGGKYINKDLAVSHGIKMLDDGADIIDIGGQSSRPGAENVNLDEELKRTIPVIEKIIKERPNAIISIDTVKSLVAEHAVESGAKIINDISGFKDENILNVAAKNNSLLVIMHMKGMPQTMQDKPYYNDVITEIYDFLSKKIDIAKEAGVRSFLIDPGIGFGKRVVDNFTILNRLDEFRGLGYPIIIGISRKSLIGKSLNLDIDDRDNATMILETDAVQKGARIIRTHNVKNAIQLKQLNSFVNKPELLKGV